MSRSPCPRPRHTWSVYDLRISTVGEPGAGPALRQLRVPGSLTFDDLHACIGLAFGWSRRPPHRYVFELGELRFLPLVPDDEAGTGEEAVPGDARVFDAEFTRLEQAGLQAGDVMRYVHDFAEFHIHHIVTARVESARQPDLRPRCIAGEGVALVGEGAFEVEAVNRAFDDTFASLVPEPRGPEAGGGDD